MRDSPESSQAGLSLLSGVWKSGPTMLQPASSTVAIAAAGSMRLPAFNPHPALSVSVTGRA